MVAGSRRFFALLRLSADLADLAAEPRRPRLERSAGSCFVRGSEGGSGPVCEASGAIHLVLLCSFAKWTVLRKKQRIFIARLRDEVTIV